MNEVAVWNRLKSELINTDDIVELSKHSIQIEAIKNWGKKSRQSIEMRNDIAAYQIRLERLRGQWIEKNIPAEGGNKNQKQPAKFGRLMPTLKDAGVGHHESPKLRALAKIPEDKIEELIKNKISRKQELTLKDTISFAKRIISYARKIEEVKEDSKKMIGYIEPELRIGDFRKVFNDIEENSIDLILTDPPYGKDSIILYQELGQFAKKALKPDGSLLAYCGQSVLREVLNVLSASLRYWWTICLEHSGGGQKLPGKWVFVDWKPIVWFVNEKRRGKNFISDKINGDPPDKTSHEWAQGIMEVKYLIEQFTDENNLIIDPFAGTGMWGEIAGQLGRKWIGCDMRKTEF